MKLFKEAGPLHEYLLLQQAVGKTIGFVPTMGALHMGHISLVQLSLQQSDLTVCSIFVNPTQFNDKNDFDNYPVNIGSDIHLLEQTGCDVLFLPQANEIYPGGTGSLPHYNIGYLETILEGEHRPGHYQGVCQVVDRLLGIVNPHLLLLGQKDFQQCMVLKQLVTTTGKQINVIIGETYRESSGLAMSSRNQRLTSQERDNAKAIFEALTEIRNQYLQTSNKQLCIDAAQYLLSQGFSKVDYVMVADAATLQPLPDNSTNKAVALIAAFIGNVRLIDNLLLN